MKLICKILGKFNLYFGGFLFFRGKFKDLVVKCSIDFKHSASGNVIPKHILSGLVASCIFFSQANLVSILIQLLLL